MKPTLNEVLKELNRELATRKRVYPDWTRGAMPKLTKTQAEHRIACIEVAILKVQSAIKQEQAQIDLFQTQNLHDTQNATVIS